jgi:uncharacterized protein (DUF433 family)
MKFPEFTPLIVERIKQELETRDIIDEIAKNLNNKDEMTRRRIRCTIYHVAYKNALWLRGRRASTKNLKILEQRRAGMTFPEIGEIHGITRQRVQAIVSRYDGRNNSIARS